MNVVKNRNYGFTLIELLIAFAIVAILMVMAVEILNSIGATNKGNDIRRKKDLHLIKVTLEEYYNDHGSYPDVALLTKLVDKNNCGKTITEINLRPWPCDPNGESYKIVVDTSRNMFKVLTNLGNTTDKEIPVGWYKQGVDYRLDGYSIYEVNYGVSSTNILWNDMLYDYQNDCDMTSCVYIPFGGGCNAGNCDGSNCFYLDTDRTNNCDAHTPRCRVNHCVGQ